MGNQEYLTGDGRCIKLEEITNTYRDIVNNSSPSSGKIHALGKDHYSLTCTFNTIDCDTLESVKNLKTYALVKSENGEHIESVQCTSRPLSIGDLATVVSDNGRFIACLKGTKNDSKKQLLEIWDRSKLLKTIDIGDAEDHGLINTDSHFSSMRWSQFGEQNKLLYVCQEKKQKTVGFFKQQVKKVDVRNIGDGAPKEVAREQNLDTKEAGFQRDNKSPIVGGEYIRAEDWGEALNGIEHTIVASLEVPSFKVTTFNLDGFSLADTKWLNDGNQIVSTAYSERPRRIGVVYCNSRPSKLVIHDVLSGSVVEELAEEGSSYYSPRVSHCGRKLIHLKNTTFGAHAHSQTILLYDLNSKSTEQLYDDLFIENLPQSCFSSDDRYVLFVKREKLHNFMSMLNLSSKKLSKIKFPTAGVQVFDFRYDIILASGSEVNTSPTLYVATFNSVDLVAWHQMEECLHSDDISYQEFNIETSDKSSHISGIFISPILDTLYRNLKVDDLNTKKSESELPTFVTVHGGPHGAYANSYISRLIFFARMGLKVLLINYRGSTGVDENYVQSLCGHIGTMDLDDCLQAIRYFVKNKSVDPSKLIIEGGSHGGFLACHLCCQDEFAFTSAIIRNPVIDLASVHMTSDIEDWSLAEGLGQTKFNFTTLPGRDDLMKLWEQSPFSKIQKANVPTLMVLGSNDRRVPMYHGERWFKILNARGIDSKCKIYADKHDLAKPDVAADWTMTAIIWIFEHLKVKS